MAPTAGRGASQGERGDQVTAGGIFAEGSPKHLLLTEVGGGSFAHQVQ